ncbi:MAG: Asp-tRNA(Asn)/Glu-tRNA(Gln) amidotransferase subunit GatB [Chloroflexota bacterium]
MEYEAVIGMEVHAQILTRSKMFCGCSADYAAAPPNTHTCPVCLGMPGVLPVINHAAVIATIRTGLALGCDVPAFSKFDRKNYTYPDLPKGYQISQFDYPLCTYGALDIVSDGQPKRMRIRRVHLEEDTGKLMHAPSGSVIDFNRAGVPLMEIVSEADLRTAEEAWQYLLKLRAILRYLGVNSGNMEEGALRCEANISIRPVGSAEFGTKVEVKNLNSFRAVRMAIAYELERQAQALESGAGVQQVTMGWDDVAHRTVVQRTKESSEDYRYFPEPDLPPLEFTPEQVAAWRATLPELPDARRQRFVAQLGLREADAALLAEDREVGDYYERAVAVSMGASEPQTIANWTLGELFRLVGENGQPLAAGQVSPEGLVGLLRLVGQGAINQTVAKDVLAEMFRTGQAADAIVQLRGLTQISDAEALRGVIAAVLDDNPKPVQQYLAGEIKVLGFLTGLVMRATRGQANVALMRELLAQEIEKRRA